MKHLNIDHSSGVPIYVQLKQKIKYAIAANIFPPETKLPTVRSLAVALKINVNTVSKVYSELEQEGILVTKQGKGTFVKKIPAPEEKLRQERLEQLARYILVEAYEMGLKPEELLNMLQETIKKN
ncbi:MAG: GntR family transcriptional regulator [Thermoanaerobacteraceae bacterium]|nr:GntR family transcriptional regulator [Thermoanaerobacteraceae bacterium]